MKKFRIVEYYLGKKCGFYSVKIDDNKHSEIEKFFDNISDKYPDAVSDIQAKIEKMGDRTGCSDIYFKEQGKKDNWVYRLRKTGKPKLYCIRYSGCAVILGCGDIKEEEGATQDDPKLQSHIELLEQIFYILDGEIIIEENRLSGEMEYQIN